MVRCHLIFGSFGCCLFVAVLFAYHRLFFSFFQLESFLLEPETRDMFGFPNAQHDDPELSKNYSFIQKGARLVEAIGTAVSFLGPDLGPLENVLFQLGMRHVARRCKPKHFPLVGEVLFYIFEVATGDAFTFKVRTAWIQIYNFLSHHMIKGLLYADPSLAPTPSPVVAVSATPKAEDSSVTSESASSRKSRSSKSGKEQMKMNSSSHSRAQDRKSVSSTRSRGQSVRDRLRERHNRIEKNSNRRRSSMGTTSTISSANESIKEPDIGAEFDVMTPINHEAISRATTELVVKSWNSKVKKLPNWKELTGEMFMRKW